MQSEPCSNLWLQPTAYNNESWTNDSTVWDFSLFSPLVKLALLAHLKSFRITFNKAYRLFKQHASELRFNSRTPYRIGKASKI